MKQIVILLLAGLTVFPAGLAFGYHLGYQSSENNIRVQLQSSEYPTVKGLVDDYRINKGFKPLPEDPRLCKLAEERVEEIITDWSHNGYTRRTPILFSSYCPECSRIGENLARGYTTPEDTLTAWLNSPLHRANLDQDYNMGCLRYRISNGEVFIAHIFGTK